MEKQTNGETDGETEKWRYGETDRDSDRGGKDEHSTQLVSKTDMKAGREKEIKQKKVLIIDIFE